MNIFYLDHDPKLAAQYHCDKHVVKMCIEYAQLLSTTVRLLVPEQCTENYPYKATHVNHPCAVWTRQSYDNFEFLGELLVRLGEEYTTRYGKLHKSVALMEELTAPASFPFKGFTEPPQCMPVEYKSFDTVESYRTYYMCEKKYFATWKTQPPYWWTN